MASGLKYAMSTRCITETKAPRLRGYEGTIRSVYSTLSGIYSKNCSTVAYMDMDTPLA